MANFLKEVVCLLTEQRIPYIFNVEPDGSAYITFHEEIHSPLKTIYCHNAIDPAILCFMENEPVVPNKYQVQNYFYSVAEFKLSGIFRLLNDKVEDYQFRQANEKVNKLIKWK